MTREATRDAHRPLSGPASPWDHAAYGRWLSGVEQGRERRRESRLPAVVSVILALASLAVAWQVGVISLYVGWLVEMVGSVR